MTKCPFHGATGRDQRPGAAHTIFAVQSPGQSYGASGAIIGHSSASCGE